jgi:hypothetical protein
MKNSKGSKAVKLLSPILKKVEERRFALEELCSEVDEEIEEEVMEEEIKVEDEKEDENRFKTIEQFKEYYEKNKDRIDKMSTCVLNKTYKIDGYKIRKNYGVIGFRHVNPKISKMNNEKRIEELEEVVNQMIVVLNEVQERLKMI